MATIEAIGEAIGAAAETLSGMRSQQEWDEAPNVSGSALVAVVEYDGTEYDTAFGGTATAAKFKVTVLGPSPDRPTRAKLRALCDPTPGSAASMRTALSGNLGGIVVDCRVASNGGLRDIKLAGGDDAPTYSGVEFNLEVMPS